MTLEQLLAMLGVSTTEEAAAAINRFNSFLTDAKVATGKSSAPEALSELRAQSAFAKSVESELGAVGPAALAKLAGLKASNERVVELEQRAKNAEKATADRDAHAAIDKATSDRKLLPANRSSAEGIYAKYGIDGLNSYIEMLPVNSAAPAPVAGRQLPTNTSGAPATLTDDERKLAKALGVGDEDIVAGHKNWDDTRGEISSRHTQQLNEKQQAAAKAQARA